MRIVDLFFNTLEEYDESKGRFEQTKTVKSNAQPIDNITKFAWDDDDYEDVLMYIPNRKPEPIELTAADDLDAMMIDHELRLTLLELGL